MGAVARARAEHDARGELGRDPRDIGLSAPWIDERDEELVLEVLRSGRLSLGPSGRASRRAGRGGRRAALRRGVLGHGGPAPLHGDRGRRARRRGDHVAVLVRRLGELRHLRGRDAGLRRHRPADAEPRPGRGRGRDHAADEGDRRRRHLRLPLRARRAARDLRPPRPRPRRGRLRGARRPLQGPPARLARPPRDLGLLPEQADHDRRGRRRHDRLGGASTSCSCRCATRAGSRPRAGSSTAASASTTGSTTSRRRSASGSSRSSTAILDGRRAVAARYTELLAGRRRRDCRSPTTTTTSARGSSTS